MTAFEWAWGMSFISALWLIPIGIIRMVAWRSGEIDHTRGMLRMAWFVLGTGLAALAVFVTLSLFALAAR